MSRPTSRVLEVRVAGPLAPFSTIFQTKLKESGYTPLTTVVELRLMAHLSRWLEAGHLGVADLTSESLELFLAAQRAGGYGHAGSNSRRCPGPANQTERLDQRAHASAT